MKITKLAMMIGMTCAIATANAQIPGFGLTYGQGNVYGYNEFNANPHLAKDQYFLSYWEVGLMNWLDAVVQYTGYPDGSWNGLDVGGLAQLWKCDRLNLVGGATYGWNTAWQMNKEDRVTFLTTANGVIYKSLGYILQTGAVTSRHAKPSWYQNVYLTWNFTDDLVGYLSTTYEPNHIDRTMDFAVGGWYTVLRDQLGVQWANLYFDVGNLTEKCNDLRISVGIDFLF